MDLVFATEARFVKNKLGDIYSIDGAFTKQLWLRYLVSFDNIYVVSRVKYDADYIAEKNFLANDKRIFFIELPYFVGPFEFIRNRKKIKNVIKNSLPLSGCAYICRVPGTISILVISLLNKKKIRYGLEVVGDPWDIFAPDSIQHPLRPFLRWQGYLSLKSIVKKASAILYVTRFMLQKRYTASQGAYVTHASDIRLEESYLAVRPKTWSAKSRFKIISIGSLSQMYKSPDVVLESIRNLKDMGIICDLLWLGDGRYRSEMVKLADRLKISSQVIFFGNVSSEQVRGFLSESDIFVLASRTEGLPRAIIEAMAVGLPCIGSRVGGIPELLEERVLIEPGDYMGLAQKIEQLISDESFYNSQSQRNLIEAQNYLDTFLTERRRGFYQILKNIK